MNNNITSAVAEIAAAQAKGSRFASLTYRAKGTGELARFTVLLGADLEKAYRRDLAIIRKRISRNTDPLRGQALAEIECSLAESLKVGIGNNSRYTKKETYVQVVPGIKVAKETGELYITGFRTAKVVLERGTYKTVNSKPLTIAKDEERKTLKIGRFREFAFSPDNIEAVRCNGREVVVVGK